MAKLNNSEEMTKKFHQILAESDEKHAEAVRRREAKKREIFALLGDKPSKNDKK